MMNLFFLHKAFQCLVIKPPGIVLCLQIILESDSSSAVEQEASQGGASWNEAGCDF